MDELLYKNLIAQFFVDKTLICQHSQRIENCFQYVATKLPPLSVRAKETIVKSIKSVEITFLKRWRETKCANLGLFQQDNEKWVHTILKVSAFYAWVVAGCMNCPLITFKRELQLLLL